MVPPENHIPQQENHCLSCMRANSNLWFFISEKLFSLCLSVCRGTHISSMCSCADHGAENRSHGSLLSLQASPVFRAFIGTIPPLQSNWELGRSCGVSLALACTGQCFCSCRWFCLWFLSGRLLLAWPQPVDNVETSPLSTVSALALWELRAWWYSPVPGRASLERQLSDSQNEWRGRLCRLGLGSARLTFNHGIGGREARCIQALSIFAHSFLPEWQLLAGAANGAVKALATTTTTNNVFQIWGLNVQSLEEQTKIGHLKTFLQMLDWNLDALNRRFFFSLLRSRHCTHCSPLFCQSHIDSALLYLNDSYQRLKPKIRRCSGLCKLWFRDHHWALVCFR